MFYYLFLILLEIPSLLGFFTFQNDLDKISDFSKTIR